MAALAICMVIMITGCNLGKGKLAGNWACRESVSDYPDQIMLDKDGTGVADGMTMNWSESNGVLMLTFALGSYEYRYKVSGSVLYLDGYAYDKR